MEGLLSPMRTKVRGANLDFFDSAWSYRIGSRGAQSLRTGGSLSFCLVTELGWRMQLDLSKNRLASKAARCVGRVEQGGESHLSVWTMGILVNEFSPWLIRQPYFSRISSHSSLGAMQLWELFVAGSTNCSGYVAI